MADNIMTALLAMQAAINETIRYEVGQARAEFRAGIEVLRHEQDAQERDLEHLRDMYTKLEERTKLTSRGLLSALTRKQRAALGAFALAAGGAILDGLRHLLAFILAAMSGGVAQP